MVDAGGVGLSSRDRRLHRDLDLPFTPVAGLTIRDYDWEATLENVIYSVNEKRFIAQVKTDNSMFSRPMSQRTPELLQELVDEYLELGWEEIV